MDPVLLPGTLPEAPENWQVAPLPALYTGAIEALALCESTDECAEWSRKADAMASYYRQAQDQTMFNIAQRIKLRAIRRCGELFLQSEDTVAAHAERHSIAPQTLRVGKRMAGVPQQVFEARVEETPAPTVRRVLGNGAAPEHSKLLLDLFLALNALAPHLTSRPLPELAALIAEEVEATLPDHDLDTRRKIMIRLAAELLYLLNQRFTAPTIGVFTPG